MARRRAIEPADVVNGLPAMPKHLVKFTGTGAQAFSDFNHERNEWLRSHGINPGDWPKVKGIAQASRKAHGLPDRSALTRARLRAGDES